ncbi:MAG: hypothetical protein A2126_03795 [Candidatus Woykebacteria bacterium GWB1_45_5]|uniref:Uncharacterized protein n=2 Tax=Candidatus Woykeibacteriota TaxID=1817899 RepID=A0A1G1W520_9BACT|nr:MAG: hypothetical protein A2113_02280 [Candidatus Woykebacteria bacterium GWA1_44_8]OGY23607.1 MAG: hypothetical protein A2126_03795 [Candidatus Woykebacteria bacterium GWB1_45_5]
MNDSTVENKDEKQVEGKKASSVISIARMVFAGFLIWLGASMVSLYHWGIIFGGNIGITLTHSVHGNILPGQTMADWFVEMADSSAILGIREILIWILVPSLLILTALILFRPKSLVKMTLIGLCVGGIIYGAAVISNKYDASRKKNFFLNSRISSSSQEFFDLIKYPGVQMYYYEDIQRPIDQPEEIRFTFYTIDKKEKVEEYYLAKGFTPYRIKITEESNGLKVELNDNL